MSLTRAHFLSLLAIWLSTAAFATLPMAASAQTDGSSTGRAQAVVVEPLRAVALSDLSFGAVFVDRNQGSTITVPAGGGSAAYSNSAQAHCTGQVSCAPHRAHFAIKGQSDRLYSVELAEQVIARGAASGARLVVDDLVMRSLSQPNRANGGRLDQSGQDHLFIGGTLRVPAGTQSDVFRATLRVMVTYD